MARRPVLESPKKVLKGAGASRPQLSQWLPREMVADWVGRGRRWTQAATPNRAGTHGNRSILHDFEDDRISRHIGNETRSLGLMSALRVNSGTAKQKDRPKVVSAQRFFRSSFALQSGLKCAF